MIDKDLRKLVGKYLVEGYGSVGDKEAQKYYREAAKHIKLASKYYTKSFLGKFVRCDYEMYSEYADKGYKEEQLIDEPLLKAIEHGHDLALLHYAILVYCKNVDIMFWQRIVNKTYERDEVCAAMDETLKWLQRADELGFAPAAYMLSVFYRSKNKFRESDEEKSEYYYSRYRSLCDSSERQRILSMFIPSWADKDGARDPLSFKTWFGPAI